MLNGDLILQGIAALLGNIAPIDITRIEKIETKLADQIKIADTINISLYLQRGASTLQLRSCHYISGL